MTETKDGSIHDLWTQGKMKSWGLLSGARPSPCMPDEWVCVFISVRHTHTHTQCDNIMRGVAVLCLRSGCTILQQQKRQNGLHSWEGTGTTAPLQANLRPTSFFFFFFHSIYPTFFILPTQLLPRKICPDPKTTTELILEKQTTLF